jgi:putative PIN family toxin of toxin-antitoxin system
LDTNIVLSALIFSNGRLAPIRQAWQQELLNPLVSKSTTEELIRGMSYPKFKLSGTDRDELLADYLPYCAIVKIPTKAPRVPACRDPLDLPFLHLAVAGKAKFLVTGDRDLLEVRGQLAFAIVAATEFIAALGLG